MEQKNKNETVTGETCEIPGDYLSAGCGHLTRKALEIGEVFPGCPACGKSIAWIRQPSNGARTYLFK